MRTFVRLNRLPVTKSPQRCAKTQQAPIDAQDSINRRQVFLLRGLAALTRYALSMPIGARCTRRSEIEHDLHPSPHLPKDG